MSRLDLASPQDALQPMADALGAVRVPAFAGCAEPLQRTIEAGMIQNVEFCFELATKMLKRELERATEDPQIDALAWRDMVRPGAERGLVADPEHWFGYRRKRDITSHTRDREKAIDVLAVTASFHADAVDPLARLARRHGS